MLNVHKHKKLSFPGTSSLNIKICIHHSLPIIIGTFNIFYKNTNTPVGITLQETLALVTSIKILEKCYYLNQKLLENTPDIYQTNKVLVPELKIFSETNASITCTFILQKCLKLVKHLL